MADRARAAGFASHPLRGELVEFAEQLADLARELLAGQTDGAGFESKSAANPVTVFDRAVELELRSRIDETYPYHGIVGEEFPDRNREAEFVWVLDPIDGTRAFAAGVPVFTSLIALCYRALPVIGIIEAPATQERWLGVTGATTTKDGQAVVPRRATELASAIVAWGYPEVALPEHAAGLASLKAATAWRVYGSGSYGVGRLASGGIDVAVESGDVAVSDLCAFVPIVNGAGGVCTDAFGAPITLDNGSSCLAAGTPELHAAALRILADP